MTSREIIELDVSEYEAPIPLELILKAIHVLKQNQCLNVKHRLEPFGLYPHLINLSFKYSTVRNNESDFIIKIWRE